MGHRVPIEIELIGEGATPAPFVDGLVAVAAELTSPEGVGLVGGAQPEHDPLGAGQIEVAEQVEPVRPLRVLHVTAVDDAHPRAELTKQQKRWRPDGAAWQGEPASDTSGPEKRRAQFEQRLGAIRKAREL